MSSRALRRKQLQQQEEQALEVNGSEPELITRQKFSAFSLLDTDTHSQSEEDESSSLVASSESEKEAVPIITPVNNSRRKNKNKNKKATQKEEEDLNNIEFPSEDQIIFDNSVSNAVMNPFEIDLNYLDPEVELREKMTGKKPLANNKKKVKMTLAGPQTKTKIARHSLHELGFSFIFTSGNYYMNCTEDYEVTRGLLVHLVQLGDVEGILQLLRDHPCHLDTLLVVSDILKHQSTTEASLLVNKAILLIHKALDLIELPSLPYGDERNRVMHLALFRRVQFLLKQGCWKTALQVSKALYALDKSDPLQIELVLQFLSLQASDDAILQYFTEKSDSPGWRLTRLYKDFDSAELSEFLEEYPEAYSPLTNNSNQNEEGGREEGIERMYYKNYFSLYMLYSGPLWKNNPGIKSLKKSPSIQAINDDLNDAMLGMYRHQALVASDHSSLRLGFPAKLLSQPILLINPFPPLEEFMCEPVSLIDRARSLITSLIP